MYQLIKHTFNSVPREIGDIKNIIMLEDYNDYLGILKKYIKEINKKIKEEAAPLKEEIQLIKNKWNSKLKEAEAIINKLTIAISDYHKKKQLEARQFELAAKAAGNEIKVPDKKNYKTSRFTNTIISEIVFDEVINIELIPKEFTITTPNIRKINENLKLGLEIPGIKTKKRERIITRGGE